MTMKQILEETRAECAQTAWERAVMASKLAKVATTTKDKNLLYGLKLRGVAQVVRMVPGRTRVGDLTFLSAGIVGVCVNQIGKLHVPIRRLEPQARQILEGKLAEKRNARAYATPFAISTPSRRRRTRRHSMSQV